MTVWMVPEAEPDVRRTRIVVGGMRELLQLVHVAAAWTGATVETAGSQIMAVSTRIAAIRRRICRRLALP